MKNIKKLTKEQAIVVVDYFLVHFIYVLAEALSIAGFKDEAQKVHQIARDVAEKLNNGPAYK